MFLPLSISARPRFRWRFNLNVQTESGLRNIRRSPNVNPAKDSHAGKQIPDVANWRAVKQGSNCISTEKQPTRKQVAALFRLIHTDPFLVLPSSVAQGRAG